MLSTWRKFKLPNFTRGRFTMRRPLNPTTLRPTCFVNNSSMPTAPPIVDKWEVLTRALALRQPEAALPEAAPEATAAAAPEATPEVTPDPPAEADPATAPEVTGAADAASAAPETSLVATPLKAIAALLSRFSCRAIVAILLYVSTAELGLKDYTKYSPKNLSMLDEFAPPPPPPSVGITTLVAAIVASYVAGAVSGSAATIVASFVGGAVSVLAVQQFLGRGPLSSRRAKMQ